MAEDFFIYCSKPDGFFPENAAKILPIGWPVFSSPIPVLNVPLVLRQEYFCHASKFVPTPYNTAHPDFPDFILCNESERQDAGANCVKWVRTYAKKPDTYSVAGSLSYNFIGFKNTATLGGAGRDRFSRTVASRIQFDYYLIDANNIKSPLEVPIVDEYRYYLNNAGQTYQWFTDNLFSEQVSDPANVTVPSMEAYLKLVKAKTEIVAQASTLRIWMGNIIERQTVYILPL